MKLFPMYFQDVFRLKVIFFIYTRNARITRNNYVINKLCKRAFFLTIMVYKNTSYYLFINRLDNALKS
jgi:hypothetical protein